MKRAVGGIPLSLKTKRILLQLRASDKNDNFYWGFFGGIIEKNETITEALNREMKEETNFSSTIKKYIPLHLFTSNDTNFQYYTYIILVENEFIPILNEESVGYSWTDYDKPPEHLHINAKSVMYNPKILSKIRAIIDQQALQFA